MHVQVAEAAEGDGGMRAVALKGPPARHADARAMKAVLGLLVDGGHRRLHMAWRLWREKDRLAAAASDRARPAPQLADERAAVRIRPVVRRRWHQR